VPNRFTLSVGDHIITWELQTEFSGNFILGGFTTTCAPLQVLLKSNNNNRYSWWPTCISVHVSSVTCMQLAKFQSKKKYSEHKLYRKILCSVYVQYPFLISVMVLEIIKQMLFYAVSYHDSRTIGLMLLPLPKFGEPHRWGHKKWHFTQKLKYVVNVPELLCYVYIT
jgi:hypothetical protein